MAQVGRTWVLAEQRDGVPIGIVLELVTAARGFGGVVEVVTWGPGCERGHGPRPLRSDQAVQPG